MRRFVEGIDPRADVFALSVTHLGFGKKFGLGVMAIVMIVYLPFTRRVRKPKNAGHSH